nr:hypothetical protein [Tanacetum cinerariifolium]
LDQHLQEPYKNHRIQLLPIEHSAQVGDIVEFETAIAQTFLFFIIAVQTLSSGISILLAVGTPSTGSGNLCCQWEHSPGSGNALCILFPTKKMVKSAFS